jgi:DNA-binding protein Fis
MPRRSSRQRAEQARDLALAFLGATSADEIHLKRVVDAHIRKVLVATDDNLSLAAKLLGMHRRSLQRHASRRKLRKPKLRKNVPKAVRKNARKSVGKKKRPRAKR